MAEVRRRVAALLLVVLLVGAAAACSSASGSAAPVSTSTVDLPQSYRFAPADIAVQAGTTVTWTNHDNFTHTVKVEDGPDHKIDRGKSVTIRFAKAGTYKYLCTLHSRDMHGKVIVK